MHFLDLESRNKPREPQPITDQIQKRTEPAFIEPMQCKSVTALPAGEKWTFEIKFDGYRCIAVKRGSEVTLFLATRKVHNNPFPKVVNALASLGCDFVRDGELVALDSQGSLPFRFCKTSRFIEKRPWSCFSPLEGPSSRLPVRGGNVITKTKVGRAAKLLPCRRHSQGPKKAPLWEASSPSAQWLAAKGGTPYRHVGITAGIDVKDRIEEDADFRRQGPAPGALRGLIGFIRGVCSEANIISDQK